MAEPTTDIVGTHIAEKEYLLNDTCGESPCRVQPCTDLASWSYLTRVLSYIDPTDEVFDETVYRVVEELLNDKQYLDQPTVNKILASCLALDELRFSRLQALLQYRKTLESLNAAKVMQKAPANVADAIQDMIGCYIECNDRAAGKILLRSLMSFVLDKDHEISAEIQTSKIDMTCYDWYYGRNCAMGDEDCRYQHRLCEFLGGKGAIGTKFIGPRVISDPSHVSPRMATPLVDCFWSKTKPVSFGSRNEIVNTITRNFAREALETGFAAQAPSPNGGNQTIIYETDLPEGLLSNMLWAFQSFKADYNAGTENQLGLRCALEEVLQPFLPNWLGLNT